MKKYLFVLLSTIGMPLFAADISVVGILPGKAVLVVDDASPKIYAVGQKIASDATLVAVDGDSATVTVGNKRFVIPMGGQVSRASNSQSASTVLSADGQGHFTAQGQINGGTVRLLVDTGATMVALPASEASRLGINYRSGTPVYINTANGMTTAYKVKLDRVKIGDIEVNQVDAVIQESGLPISLLGMSFLNRTEMRRSGDQMVLTKRF